MTKVTLISAQKIDICQCLLKIASVHLQDEPQENQGFCDLI
jgi:hypothetical protein